MRRFAAVVLAVVLVLALAACGSNLTPEEAARAAGTTSYVAGGDATPVASTGQQQTDGSTVVEGPAVSEPGTTSSDGTTSDRGPVASSGNTAPGATTDPDPGAKAPTQHVDKGDCTGLRNGDGITDSTITIGNTADVTGAAPGIFAASQDAVQAYVAYFNATDDICGRKLALKTYDSKVDGAAEQQAYVAGCDEVFAMVGSMSSFDGSGAGTAASCGLPDLRTASITPQRIECRTCFGALSSNPGEFQNAIPDFVLKNYGDAGKHAAMLYIDIGAAPDNAKAQAAIFSQRGMHFDYVQAIALSDFNYTPYVQQMKDKGIQYVQMIGSDSTAVRLAQTMQQQGFKPAVYLLDPSVYKRAYVAAGGSAVDGTVVFTSMTPFEEASRNAELSRYLTWLDQVKPGAEPTFFGAYAWSAAKLFVETAAGLGGRLDRASLVAALAKVDGWTADGMHAPQRVGVKRVGPCNRFITLQAGTWVPVGGTKYTCTGTTVRK